VPVIKPQVAFFERCGSAGVAALEAVLAEARDAGLLVIADAKRGDIGSTVEAYARAWLDPGSPLRADAVTAAPYLGLGALQPMVDLAGAGGRGVIVVARSSNPEGRSLQQARTDDGRGPAVEDMLLAGIAELNTSGRIPTGTVGAVIGATLGPSRFRLADLGGVILAPGVGAQGGTAAGVGALFGECPRGTVLASSSRSLLTTGPEVHALAEAARKARDEMAGVLS
jgi:orotidine-5'-phosphate decarboxylase